MNILKKISVAASVIAVATLSSCSDKGYWDEAPRQQAYYFTSANCNQTLTTGENEIVIPIERLEGAKEESIDVVFTPGKNCPSDITVESPVTFAAGSTTANVVVKITNAVPPYTYAGTLTFDGNKSYSGISAVTFNCPVAYTWTSLGTGAFIDAWVMDNAEDMYDVEILKAEGFERYRVMNPYKEYYTTIGPESYGDWLPAGTTGPQYIEFWEQEDGSLSFNAYASGLLYDGTSGQSINLYPWNTDGLSGGSEGLDIWYEPGYAVLSPIYYIPGLGGFGQQKYAVQIVLPE